MDGIRHSVTRARRVALLAAAALGALATSAAAAPPPVGDPDARAAATVKAMTQDEKLRLVYGWFGSPFDKGYVPPPEAIPGSAGYVPGVPRLNVPPQWETDAGMGVASQRTGEHRERTLLPSGLMAAAAFDPEVAYRSGQVLGAEARASGFNVVLGGGTNLLREPRNGRNFEYGGEDPLLAGMTAGGAVRGVQSQHVVSTLKHYALNDQETLRASVDVKIDADAARMSDLLAFEIALEQSHAGAVMCSYNLVNGVHACENDTLLNQALKRDWGFKGYVMSDWGGVHSTARAANAGLDQESAWSFDKEPYFGEALKAAVAKGEVSPARLDDMAQHILRSLYAVGVVDDPVAKAPIDYDAHAHVVQAGAEAGIVLLKNEGGVLPLVKTAKRIAIIGSHADAGVLSGGGSAQVYPRGGPAAPPAGPDGFPGPLLYFPSSPMKALQARLPGADIRFDSGEDPTRAAKLAAASDVVLVFAHQWTAESLDFSLTLPDGQDALISAIAAANPKTVVVLETGGPVFMPWLPKAAGVVEAWYPGSAGGEAIARVLTGEVDAAGRLPATFPASLDQLPRLKIDGEGLPDKSSATTTYAEGAAVGYRWYDAKGFTPLFPFGHGLSYTRFAFGGLTVSPDGRSASFTVANTGARPGFAVPQLYAGHAGWEAPRRLVAFTKLELKPGERREVTVAIDPRLLALFRNGGWTMDAGPYAFTLGASSRDPAATAQTTLPARSWSAAARP